MEGYIPFTSQSGVLHVSKQEQRHGYAQTPFDCVPKNVYSLNLGQLQLHETVWPECNSESIPQDSLKKHDIMSIFGQ